MHPDHPRPIRRAIVAAFSVCLIIGAGVARAEPQQTPPARPGAAGAQGKIVLIQGHVDAAVAGNQEKWDPADGPSQIFVNRCAQYAVTPPPTRWDGVHVMTTK